MGTYLRFIFENWRLLTFGALLCAASSFGQTYFISLYAAEIKGAFSLSDGAFGTIYSVGTLASAAVLLWTGPLIDKIDLRLYMAAIFVGLAGAALLMSTAQSVPVLIFTIFLLRQCGQGLPGHTAMTTMGRYFDKGRGKAVSIAAQGFPIGEAIFPILVVVVVAAIGWQQSWQAIAALLILGVIPFGLWLLGDHKSRHARYENTLERVHNNSPGSKSGEFVSWTRRDVLRDPRLYLVLPGLLAPAFIFTGLFFHQILIIVDIQGWSKTSLAASYIAFAGTTVAASLLAGIAIDRFGAARLLPYFLWPQMLAVVVLLVGKDPSLLWVYMTLTGIGTGITHTLVSAFWPEVYGRKHLGAIRSMATSMMVLSSAASPAAMGLLFDAGLSLHAIGGMLIAYAAVSIVLCMIAAPQYGARNVRSGSTPAPQS